MTDKPFAVDPWSISDPWSSGAPATPNPNSKTRIIKPIGSPEGEQYTRKGKLISAAWVNQTGPKAGKSHNTKTSPSTTGSPHPKKKSVKADTILTQTYKSSESQAQHK